MMKPSYYLSSNLLDIVFEGRNKSYGAYELRSHYERRLRYALIIMGTSMIVLSLFFRLALFHKKIIPVPPPPAKTLTLSDMKLKKPEVPPVPPPKPPAAEKLKPQIKYTKFNVVNDQLVKPREQPPDLSRIQQNTISDQTMTGSINGQDPGLKPGTSQGITGGTGNNGDRVFISVQQMPRFPGASGDAESNQLVMSFLSNHIHYPDVARENGIQGTVVVQFVVGPDGNIRDIHTVGKDPGGGLKEEAVRVIESMPRWIPGKQNGRPVSVQFTLPVRFTLR